MKKAKQLTKPKSPATVKNSKRAVIGPSNAAISVMLIVPDAESALSWYEKAYGAKVFWNLGGVAAMKINGAPFFLHEVNPDNPSETSPKKAGVTSSRIELFVDDPDAFIKRALLSRAIITSSIENHQRPSGNHRQGGIKDPFGHIWSVGDKSPLSVLSSSV
jgi:PhnB protein